MLHFVINPTLIMINPSLELRMDSVIHVFIYPDQKLIDLHKNFF